MFRTGMRGSASWAVTTSQNTPRVRVSSGVKKRSGGTFSTRSSTTALVASSQCSAFSSTS